MTKDFILLILSVVGAIITLYIIIASLVKCEMVCFANKKCNKLHTSRYRRRFLVPHAIIGLLFYVAVGWAALYGFERFDGSYYTITLTIALAAVAFSTYLLFAQRKIIKGFCGQCTLATIINAVILVFLFIADR